MLWNSPSANAELVTNVSIHDVSSELSTFVRVADYVVDGSGLTGDVHTTQPNFTMWLNSGSGGFGVPEDQTNPGGVGAVITFDLGDKYDLSEMKVWNYNEVSTSDEARRGARSVSVSTASDLSSDFQLVADYEFSKATGSGYFGEFHDLDVSGARLVKFQIHSNHFADQQSGGRLVGLSEVQFFGVSSVPEPSAVILLGVSSVAMLFQRRRRKFVIKKSL